MVFLVRWDISAARISQRGYFVDVYAEFCVLVHGYKLKKRPMFVIE